MTYDSDHSLIVARLSMSRFRGRGQEDKKIKNSRAANSRRHIRRELLIGEGEIPKKYEKEVAEKLSTVKKNGSSKKRMAEGIKEMLERGAEEAGIHEKNKKKRFQDDELEKLSIKNKDLRLKLAKTGNRVDTSMYVELINKKIDRSTN